MQTDWLKTAQILWQKYYDEKLSRENILALHCESLNFPQDDLRLRQVLKLNNLLPEFQALLNKGLHSLDYLSLLANFSTTDQKIYLDQLVTKYRIGYNHQRKIFEWLYDLLQIQKTTLNEAIQKYDLANLKSLTDFEQKLFTLRFPTYVKEGQAA
jgi:hypothetical protein